MERFGLETFDAMTLRSYYLRRGIKYKRPDYRFWKSIAENKQLKDKQMEFMLKLGTIIVEEAYDAIIYLDETTVHL